VTIDRSRPPKDADERTQLIGWLDMQRAIILWKCEGLSDKDAVRPVLPASPLMTMAGLISHMRWTEHCWFDVILAGGDTSENPQFADPEDADFLLGAETPLARLVEEYERQCARSNEIVAAYALEDMSRHAEHPSSGKASLRWILLHMIEETARHAGHADAIRELLDGEIGYY